MKSFIKYIGYATFFYCAVTYLLPSMRMVLKKRWIRSFCIPIVVAIPIVRKRLDAFYSIYIDQGKRVR